MSAPTSVFPVSNTLLPAMSTPPDGVVSALKFAKPARRSAGVIRTIIANNVLRPAAGARLNAGKWPLSVQCPVLFWNFAVRGVSWKMSNNENIFFSEVQRVSPLFSIIMGGVMILVIVALIGLAFSRLETQVREDGIYVRYYVVHRVSDILHGIRLKKSTSATILP